jgi:hypothetical protein
MFAEQDREQKSRKDQKNDWQRLIWQSLVAFFSLLHVFLVQSFGKHN